jgi:cytochrome c biogenesis protein ResB
VKRLLRVLLSRRLAILAMLAMAGLLALSSTVSEADPERLEAARALRPIRVWIVERLRPYELTHSPLFAVFPLFIAASVLASIAQRIRGHLAGRRRSDPAPLERFRARRVVEVPLTPEGAAAALAAAVRRAGFARARGGGLARHGDRGSLGFWGSMCFHAGILVTLAGVSLGSAARFDGEIVITEGFPVDVAPQRMLSAIPPERMGALAGTRLAVSDVSAEFRRETQLTDVSALLHVARPGEPERSELVSVNLPVAVEGYQLSLHRYGFAPEIVARDPGGRVRAEAVAAVRVLPPGREDEIPLEGGGALRLRLYPDYEDRGGEPASRSARPLHPVLAFRWIEGGVERAAGLVERAAEIDVQGYRVAFPALRYWADFIVGKDPGLPWFALGALLCIAGLAVRFTWHEQAWRATFLPAGSGTRIDLTLSVRYFPALLEDRAERIARALGEAGGSRA